MRPMANATCGEVIFASCTEITHRSPARRRRPSTRSRSKADRSEIRPIRPTTAAGPCGGGSSRSLDRRGSTCDDESRGAWPGDGCWVETYASTLDPPGRNWTGSVVLTACRDPTDRRPDMNPSRVERGGSVVQSEGALDERRSTGASVLRSFAGTHPGDDLVVHMCG